MHDRNVARLGRGQDDLVSPFIVNQRSELLAVREAALLDLENDLRTVGRGTRDSRIMYRLLRSYCI